MKIRQKLWLFIDGQFLSMSRVFFLLRPYLDESFVCDLCFKTEKVTCIVFQQANGGGQDIDLTLPITSTYLRRMRALGLAAGLDQAYKHPNNALQLEVSYLLR